MRTGAPAGAAVTLALLLLVQTAPTASAAGTNPFDDAGAFSVYVREDAVLNNHETEGAIAVGGTLTVRSDGGAYALVHVIAGTGDYPVPTVDGDPTRLLIGSYSAASGVVQVKGTGGTAGTALGYAKIVSPDAPFGFAERGGYTQYRDLGNANSAAQGPAIDGINQPWSQNQAGETFRTARDSVAAYVEEGPGFAAGAACLAGLADPSGSRAHRVRVTEDGGKARLELVAGVPNVVDYADLLVGWQGAMASQVVYAGATPAADTPLIVRVAPGTTTVAGSTFGGSGEYASFVMWDLSALSGPVAFGSPSRVDGSVYGPEVDLTASFAPLDGQILTRNLVTTPGSGETHAYLFRGHLDCSGTEPTTQPTSEPTTGPTIEPTDGPTTEPTGEPSSGPTTQPTSEPTTDPTGTTSPTSGAAGSGGDDPDDTLAFTGVGAGVGVAGILGLTAITAGAILLRLRRQA
ncbi:MAG: choice-of-anchor A family protein [Propionicimonas sp.]|uniref:collagen-binding domain-containing protein n=1 Tax=Propionicimonas sp. TaxID=1955623 RepID=UPI003D0C2E53